MALIATNPIVVAGTKPTFGSAASGDTAQVGPNLFLIARNASGADVTLTIAVPGLGPNGIAIPDTTVTVPATTGEVWVPLDSYYADPSDGRAHLTWSATASVTRAVVRR